jgi:hypothetical protein
LYVVVSVSHTLACPAESKMIGLVFRLLPVWSVYVAIGVVVPAA